MPATSSIGRERWSTLPVHYGGGGPCVSPTLARAVRPTDEPNSTAHAANSTMRALPVPIASSCVNSARRLRGPLGSTTPHPLASANWPPLSTTPRPTRSRPALCAAGLTKHNSYVNSSGTVNVRSAPE